MFSRPVLALVTALAALGLVLARRPAGDDAVLLAEALHGASAAPEACASDECGCPHGVAMTSCCCAPDRAADAPGAAPAAAQTARPPAPPAIRLEAEAPLAGGPRTTLVSFHCGGGSRRSATAPITVAHAHVSHEREHGVAHSGAPLAERTPERVLLAPRRKPPTPPPRPARA